MIDTEMSLLVARANGYSLLARSMAPPASWSEELVRGFREQFRPLGDELRDLAARVADTMELGPEEREAVEVAYAKLFLGPFEIEAPPYESSYRDPMGHLMGETSLAVARAYAEAGLAPATGPRETPDHITHELEFLYFLTFEEVRTGDPCWAERRSRFWASHAGGWIPRFAEQIARAEQHPFFDALAALLSRFALEEALLHGTRADCSASSSATSTASPTR